MNTEPAPLTMQELSSITRIAYASDLGRPDDQDCAERALVVEQARRVAAIRATCRI